MTTMSLYHGRSLVQGTEVQDTASRVIACDVGISFWGGIDEKTGVVIDQSHPLHGTCVAGSILVIPSGRGSCTASQVLLELILNEKAPRALILRDRDGLVSVGALVAEAIFPEAKVLDIIQISDFSGLLDENPKFGQVLADGSVVFGDKEEEVTTKAQELSPSSDGANKRDNFVLSTEEKSMMESAKTAAELHALECIFRYARIVSESPVYLDVKKAHIDGCTYIGPGGLQFAQRLVSDGGRVSIPTTLNSVSTDLRRTTGHDKVRQEAAQKLAEAYIALGCSERSFTCAPYLLENPPEKGEQIVWGESNAVVYANSFLGAKTEKYADYLDICCAIVGKVPAVGVHLKENRKPQIILDASKLDFSTDDPSIFSLLFPVLGHLCGTLSDGEVPILIGLERYTEHITSDHMKDFCAAFGTTGTSPLIHVAGVTPECNEEMISGCEKSRMVTVDQLEATFKMLDQQNDSKDNDEKIDWVSLGNPHLSLSECEHLVEQIKSLPMPRKKHDDVQVIACMSRELFEKSPSIPSLKRFGISFVNDTCWCMLLEPPMIPDDPVATILTNSGKYAHYGPGLTGRKFRLGSMADCVDAAVSGKLSRRPQSSFPWRITTRGYTYSTNQTHRGKRSYSNTREFTGFLRKALRRCSRK